MALGDPYATPEDLAERVENPDYEGYAELLDSASRMVEAFTGRQFNKADEATERRYRALDPERMPVDDFYTTDDLIVVVDGLVWAGLDYDEPVDYEPRPFDGVVNGQPGWPFSDLMAIRRAWPIRRRRTIEVTAKWGWPEVPAAIVEATLRLAESMLESISGASGTIKSETISGYSVSYELPNLATTLNVPQELIPAIPYRRRRFGVA